MERQFALWVAELIRRMNEMDAKAEQGTDGGGEDAPQGAQERGCQQ